MLSPRSQCQLLFGSVASTAQSPRLSALVRTLLALLTLFLSFLPSPLFADNSGDTPAASSIGSPRDCVVRAGEAIDTSDVDLFLDNVYLDEVLHSGIKIVLDEAKRPEVAREMSPVFALLLSQARDGEGGARVRALLATELKAFILGGIGSGAFAGRGNKRAQKSGVLAPIFAQASMGRKELVQIGEEMKTPDGWSVSCTLLDFGNGLEYPIEALVQEVDGRYKVTGILNLPHLFERIREEARQFEE